MRFILTLVVVLIAGAVQGQVNQQILNEESKEGLVGGINDLWNYNTVKRGAEEITGNRFLFEGWNNKGLIYSEGIAYAKDQLNYNVYSDEIAELQTQNEVFIFDKAIIDSVSISGRRFHKLNGSFYEVLSKGAKVTLLIKYETRIQEGQFNPTDGTTTPSRLVQMQDHYIVMEGAPGKFKPTKNSVLELCADHEKEMKQFIKEENLSYKKDQDLKRIFDFYNKL